MAVTHRLRTVCYYDDAGRVDGSGDGLLLVSTHFVETAATTETFGGEECPALRHFLRTGSAPATRYCSIAAEKPVHH